MNCEILWIGRENPMTGNGLYMFIKQIELQGILGLNFFDAERTHIIVQNRGERTSCIRVGVLKKITQRGFVFLFGLREIRKLRVWVVPRKADEFSVFSADLLAT